MIRDGFAHLGRSRRLCLGGGDDRIGRLLKLAEKKKKNRAKRAVAGVWEKKRNWVAKPTEKG